MREEESECLCFMEELCRIVVWNVGSGGRAPESIPGDKLLPLSEPRGDALSK